MEDLRQPDHFNRRGSMDDVLQRLTFINEEVWMLCGSLSKTLEEYERSFNCFEKVLQYNENNIRALQNIANLYMRNENYNEAISYLQKVLSIQKVQTIPQDTTGIVNRDIAYCYLMNNDLQNAYNHYNTARTNGVNDAELWYGIAIMYDKSQKYEFAEKSFKNVLSIEPNFPKTEEIHFRLGVLYKNLGRYDEALEIFENALKSTTTPIATTDILFQMGHTKELRKDIETSKKTYESVLAADPNHSYALLHLGWIHHQFDSPEDTKTSMKYILQSVKSDPTQSISWYLLGRSYMKQQEFRKAYDSYFEAILRDNNNAIFWSSVGILFYHINQYIDALRAYVRSITTNPKIVEVFCFCKLIT
eukprot:TRINITY_DN1385_c0_g2_i2.p1 TRINITY_DN1385_c0_g2~~TRINITY_DN1385_c0_g2_i2.p1  ORF type:complete len:361 (-),score=61.46 TRINITY_DN1385_c0_g2_i2:219-1301(-)